MVKDLVNHSSFSLFTQNSNPSSYSSIGRIVRKQNRSPSCSVLCLQSSQIISVPPTRKPFCSYSKSLCRQHNFPNDVRYLFGNMDIYCVVFLLCPIHGFSSLSLPFLYLTSYFAKKSVCSNPKSSIFWHLWHNTRLPRVKQRCSVSPQVEQGYSDSFFPSWCFAIKLGQSFSAC